MFDDALINQDVQKAKYVTWQDTNLIYKVVLVYNQII